jgi:LacI family transcriptional regulator
MCNARSQARERPSTGELPLGFFACSNPDCEAFNRFGGDNLSVAERMGKNKAIRRLYCRNCQSRFSERQGSLMEYSKLPLPAVVRIVKCLGHGCSVEATADICEVDARTVQRIVDRGGTRAEDFHRLSLEPLDKPLEAVQMDELHGRVAATDGEKKGGLRGVVDWVARGLMRPWK